MNTETAAQQIWDYMLMHHALGKADALLVLGSRDTRVAEYAARLCLDGWAPVLIFTGSGSIHNHKPGREKFIGSSEAQVFADTALAMGVPKEAIIIENESQNTGQNFEFAIKKLAERNLSPKKIILVQKPYMERRAYATGKVWFPDAELIVTSPPLSFDAYPMEGMDREHTINSMVGDMQRIREYPQKGFQIPQEIPDDVWEAYEYLVREGYTGRSVKE